MKKYLNGELVDMAPEEESEILSYREKIMADMPLNRWKNRMAETDAKLPRYVEDILDALDKPTRDKIAKKTLDAYNEKKAKRAEKP